MVPNGWEKTTFGEHIDLLNGFAFKSALYSDNENDIKLLRGDNIEPNKLRWRDVKRWSKTEYESLEKYHLKENDFIIAMDRTWITAGLKVAEVKQEDLPCLLVQRVSRIRSLPTLCQDLIKHHFSSYQFEQYVKSVQTETAVPHISATQIREFGLLLPPLPEQQKIAKILSTWDKAISTTERLIDNSSQQKKALMQQLLTGKKRLLDDEGNRFEGEWEVYKLSKICSINKGKQINRSTLSDTGAYPVINGGITPSGYTESSNTRANTITISEGGNSCGFVGFQNEAFWCGGHCYALQNVKTNNLFLYQFLKFIERKIMALRVGSGLPNIQKKEIEIVEILVPTHEEQQKIATVLINADQEIDLLKQQLADLQQEKKALMQQLLTGKKRVLVDGELK